MYRFFMLLMLVLPFSGHAQNTYFWTGASGNFLANDPGNWRTETQLDGSSSVPSYPFTGDFILEYLDEAWVGPSPIYSRSGEGVSGVGLSNTWNVGGSVILPEGSQFSPSNHPWTFQSLDIGGRLEWDCRRGELPFELIHSWTGVVQFVGNADYVFADGPENIHFPDGQLELNFWGSSSLFQIKTGVELKEIKSLNAAAELFLDDTLQVERISALDDLQISGGGMLSLLPEGVLAGIGMGVYKIAVALEGDSIWGIENTELQFDSGGFLCNPDKHLSIIGANGSTYHGIRMKTHLYAQPFPISFWVPVQMEDSLKIFIAKDQKLSFSSGTAGLVEVQGQIAIQNSGPDLFSVDSMEVEPYGFVDVLGGGSPGRLRVPNQKFIWKANDSVSVWEMHRQCGLRLGEGGEVLNWSGNTPEVVVDRNVGSLPWTQYSYWSCPLGESFPNTLGFSAGYTYADMSSGEASWESMSGIERGRGYALQGVSGQRVRFQGIPNLGELNENTPLVGYPTAGLAGDYWTLVGNPFLTGMNAAAFLEGNAGFMGSAIYVWDQQGFANEWGFESADYTIVNGLGNTNPNAEGYHNASGALDVDEFWIAPFQGFFVQGVNEGLSFGNQPVRFHPSMTEGTGTWGQKNAPCEKYWIELLDRVRGRSSVVLVGLCPEGSYALETGFDAPRALGEFGLGMPVDSVVLGIQRLPTSEGIEFPIRMQIDEPGEYQLRIMRTEGGSPRTLFAHGDEVGSQNLSEGEVGFVVNARGTYKVLVSDTNLPVGVRFFQPENHQVYPCQLLLKKGLVIECDQEVFQSDVVGRVLN